MKSRNWIDARYISTIWSAPGVEVIYFCLCISFYIYQFYNVYFIFSSFLHLYSQFSLAFVFSGFTFFLFYEVFYFFLILSFFTYILTYLQVFYIFRIFQVFSRSSDVEGLTLFVVMNSLFLLKFTVNRTYSISCIKSITKLWIVPSGR